MHSDNLLSGTKGLQQLIDTISRTAAITNTVPPTIVNLLRSNQLTDWELTIRETTGNTDIDLTVTLSQQNSSYIIKQPIGRGGGWQYQGFGAVNIDAVAVNAGTGSLEFSLKPITSKIPDIMVAGQTTVQVLGAIGVFSPVDNLSNATPSGYAPPFCKFVTLLPSFTSVYRWVDMTGLVVWTSAPLLHTDPAWDNIRIFPWHTLEVAGNVGAGQGLVSLWHN